MAGQNNTRAGFSIRDYNGEISNCSGFIVQATVVNLPSLLSDVGAFRTAMEDLILGVVSREYADLYNTLLSNDAPTDLNAQRERKILVFYEDTDEFLDAVNAVRNPLFRQIQTMEIPTARVQDKDGNSLLLAGTESYDFTNPYVIAFVTAFEKFFRSQAIGSVKIVDMQLVGRNL